MANIVTVETNRALAAEALLVPKTTTVNGKPLSSNIIISASDIGAISSSLLAAPNGIATLDSTGKIPPSQLPFTASGGLAYMGTWNASTNTPTLASSNGTAGSYYVVSTAGTTSINGNNNWLLNDIILFNGTTWSKISGGNNTVSSVAGKMGAVTLTKSDVGLSNVDNTSDVNKPVSTAQANADIATLAAAKAYTDLETARAQAAELTISNSISALQAGSATLSLTNTFINTSLASYTPTITAGRYGQNYGSIILTTSNTAALQTINIPANSTVAYPIGTALSIMRQGASPVKISPASGVTINSYSGYRSITNQYDEVMLIQTALNVWLLVGNLSA